MSDSTDTAEKPKRGGGRAKGEKREPRPPRDDKFFKRNDLAAAVAEKTGLPRPKAMAVVESAFEILVAKLKEGTEVRLIGFGGFVVAQRKAGKGRDPRTGAEIDIPESKSVRFRPSKALRDAVSGKVAEPTAE